MTTTLDQLLSDYRDQNGASYQLWRSAHDSLPGGNTRTGVHVDPFPGANIEQAALDFTGIDPNNPLRGAVGELTALKGVFEPVRKAVKAHGCNRAVLVGHNSFFDQGFLNAASERADIKRNPFHPFSSFDTATLAGLVYGQTVLAKACSAAGIDFDGREAHSARYDTEKTADLFCTIVNRWREMGGWPPVE